jgi:Ankyrin repeats (3 copies)
MTTNKTFLENCALGNYKEVQDIINENPNINLDGRLFAACSGGHIEIVKFFIETNINIYDPDDLDEALYGACVGGHIKIVKLLIEKRANDLDWLLHVACRGSHIEIVKILIEKGATKCGIHGSNIVKCYCPIKNYKYKELNGKKFNNLTKDLELVKLTNYEENHNGYKFKTGENKDTMEFSPIGECKPGGIYFTEKDYVLDWKKYGDKTMYWSRKVIIPDDARVYAEDDKFKSDVIILGERVKN